MERKILIERFRDPNRTLKYLKESGVTPDGKHYIGRLEGPAADFTQPTRNGNFYNLKLWRNVENSDDFKEGMDTHTIFGEADHPEERLETSIKEIAICLRKFEIREDEGIVWCSFDILDTPNGRIVKELLDYGSVLGVSSRGSGEQIMEDGQEIIDPDTYIFIGFDVVIMPAVVKARPTRVESKIYKGSTKLVESIKREVENATSKQELNSIKNIIEKQNIPGMDSIMESLNKRLQEESEDDVLMNLTTDLGKLAERNEELENTVKSLQESLSASDARVKSLNELLHEKVSNSRKLRQAIKENKHRISSLEDEIIACHEQNKDYCSMVESLRKQNSDLTKDNTRLTESYKKSKSELHQVRKELSLINSRSEVAVSTSQSYLNESRTLKDNNKSLTESINTLRKQLTESQNREKSSQEKISRLNESVNVYKKRLNSFMEGYILMKSKQSGVPVKSIRNKLNMHSSIKDVDTIVESLSDRKARINRMPINFTEAVLVNPKVEVSDEDMQTMSILSQALKPNQPK